MSVTIKDIAHKAGVSHMTVSRALNQSPLVNEKTRKRIMDIARELNYSPNLNARSLVLNKSYNIGLFFTSIHRGTAPEFFHEVADVVCDAVKDPYNVVIRSIEDMTHFDNINSRHFDGIILLSQSDQDDAFIQNVVDKSIPIVCLNRKVTNAPCVYSDDRQGAYLSMQHLLGKGCRSVGVIEGPRHFASSRIRHEGVLQAVQEAKCALNPAWVKEGDYSHDGGYAAMQALIEAVDLPEGIFCYNDDMAIGAIRALNEAGIRIPQDIRIAGFDGSNAACYTWPSLTTVHRPIRQVSVDGARMLMDIIGGTAHDEIIVLQPELIIGEST